MQQIYPTQAIRVCLCDDILLLHLIGNVYIGVCTYAPQAHQPIPQ